MIHSYKLGGFNIVLDTASGSIHSVDDVAFDAIDVYERETKTGLLSRMREKHPAVSDEDISELISDIDELKLRGKLFSPDRFAEISKSGKDKTIKALCMNVSHVCNMTCSYCFAGSGEYRGAGTLMPLETGKRAIDFLVENSGGNRTLDVDFFGGEPLLNMGVVKGIVGYARSIERESGNRFRFTLTTNGLLIDDDIIDFANKEMHNVVLSLDGLPETNDRFRRLRDGGGSYADIVPKFKKLVEARRGRGYYIRGTFTNRNLEFTEDILHTADLGFTELSMEPVVSKPDAPYGLTMDDLPVLFMQYEKLAAEMLKREKEGRGFAFYHYKLDLTGGPCIHKRLAGCGVGTEYLAVTPDGELYPCHQFVGNEDFLMGDIRLGITNAELHEKFIGRSIYTCAECRDCWARYYCSGGCAANAYNSSDVINGVYKLGCELFKKRVECAIMMKVAKASGGAEQ